MSDRAEPVLMLRGIGKTYGVLAAQLPVLQDVGFDVATGEFVAVVGASGSGKSTLLNILGCLDRPTTGVYRLQGEDVAKLDDRQLSRVRRTRIGFVFQSFHLVPHLSVEENVELPLFYARVPRRIRRRRSRAMLDRVGLSHRCGHRPTQLSGGESQRTAVARALINDPALVLADEPTGNLDSATSRSILQLFFDLHRDGRTIVMITHDPGIAAAARRRISIRDGRVDGDVKGPEQAGEDPCSPS